MGLRPCIHFMLFEHWRSLMRTPKRFSISKYILRRIIERC